MALSANVNWRVTAAGNSDNAGGFDPSLTAGMLTDGAATSATGTAPVFSSASYNFAAGDVGALLYIASGTNWTPGWYPIASVAANAATLTASIDATLGGARLAPPVDPSNNALTVAGCATTASPTGATFSVDYSPLATAKISTTDLTSTASTTVTTAGSTLTPVMVGNILRLASGAGTTPAYYAIATYVSASQATLDRASGTYTAGVSKIGGALLTVLSFGNGGTSGSPPGTVSIASPLASGHTVNIKGAGTNDPAIGSPDYDLSAGYIIFPTATTSTGRIRFVGYNGRPEFKAGGLMFYQLNGYVLNNVKAFASSTSNGAVGVVDGYVAVRNCKFDQNGQAVVCAAVSSAVNNEITNTGGATASTLYALIDSTTVATAYGGKISGNYIHSVKGGGILVSNADSRAIDFNIIYDCKGTATAAISLTNTSTTFGQSVTNNTIDTGAGDGISIVSGSVTMLGATNNSISNFSGTGLKVTSGTASANALIQGGQIDYNNLFGNGTAYSGIQAGVHDTALDPTFTNAAAGDFSIGTNLKAKAFPGVFPG